MQEYKIPLQTHLSIIGLNTNQSYWQATQYSQLIQQSMVENNERNKNKGGNRTEKQILLNLGEMISLNQFEFSRKRQEIINTNLSEPKKYIFNFTNSVKEPEILIIADQKYVFSEFNEYFNTYLIKQLQINCLTTIELPIYNPETVQENVTKIMQQQFTNTQLDYGYFIFQIPVNSIEDQRQPINIPIIFELSNAEQCPQTCKNFLALCEGSYLNSKNERLFYLNSTINRNNRAFLQAGNLDNIQGEKCIFNQQYFRDECFNLQHDQAGIISMCTQNKPHTNNCQFLISLEPMAYLQRKNMAFAKIIYGLPELQQIAQQARLFSQDQQKVDWKIIASGKYNFNISDWSWNYNNQNFEISLVDQQVNLNYELPKLIIDHENIQQKSQNLYFKLDNQEVVIQLQDMINKIINIQKQDQIIDTVQPLLIKNPQDIYNQINKINKLFLNNAFLNLNTNYNNPNDFVEQVFQYMVQSIINLKPRALLQYLHNNQGLTYYKFDQDNRIFLKENETKQQNMEHLIYNYQDLTLEQFQRIHDNQEFLQAVLNLKKIEQNSDLSKLVLPKKEINSSFNLIISDLCSGNLKQFTQKKGKVLEIQDIISIFHYLVESFSKLTENNTNFNDFTTENIILQQTEDGKAFQLFINSLEQADFLNNSTDYPQNIAQQYFDSVYFKSGESLEISQQEKIYQHLYLIGRIMQNIILQGQEDSKLFENNNFTDFFSKFDSLLGKTLTKTIRTLVQYDREQKLSYSDILGQIKQSCQEHSVDYPPKNQIKNDSNCLEQWAKTLLQKKESEKIYTIPQIKEILSTPDNKPEIQIKFYDLLDEMLVQQINDKDCNQLKLERINYIIEQAQYYKNNINNLEKSLELIKKVHQLFVEEYKIQDSKQLADIYGTIFQYAYDLYQQVNTQENLQVAIDNLQKVIETINSWNNPDFERLMKNHSQLGLIFKTQNTEESIKKSILEFQQNIKIQQRIYKSKFQDFQAFNNLGDLFDLQKQWKQSLIHYQQSLKVISQLREGLCGQSDANIIKFYQEQKQLEAKIIQEEEEEKLKAQEVKQQTEESKEEGQENKEEQLQRLSTKRMTSMQELETNKKQQDSLFFNEEVYKFWIQTRDIYHKMAKVNFEQNLILDAIVLYDKAFESNYFSRKEDKIYEAQIYYEKGEAYQKYTSTPIQPCKCINCQGNMIPVIQETDWKCQACNKKYTGGDYYSQNCKKCKEFSCMLCYEKQNSKQEKHEHKPVRCEHCFKDVKLPIGEFFKKQKFPPWSCYRCKREFEECKNNGYMCKCTKDDEWKICNPCFNQGDNRTKISNALEMYNESLNIRKELFDEQNELYLASKEKKEYCENITKDQ